MHNFFTIETTALHFPGPAQPFLSMWTLDAVCRAFRHLAEALLNDPTSPLDQRLVTHYVKCWESRRPVTVATPIVIGIAAPIAPKPLGDGTPFARIAIPVDAPSQVLDGRHRLAALILAQLPAETRLTETVPVLIIPDLTDERHAKLARASDTLRQFDRRHAQRRPLHDKHRKALRLAIPMCPFLRMAVAFGRSSMAPRSSRLFGETAAIRAIAELDTPEQSTTPESLAQAFAALFNRLAEVVQPYADYLAESRPGYRLRESTLLTTAPMLRAFARMGAVLAGLDEETRRQHLERLRAVDWGFGTPEWNALESSGPGKRAKLADLLTRFLAEKCEVPMASALEASTADRPSDE